MIEIADGVDGLWGILVGLGHALVALVALLHAIRHGLARTEERAQALAAEAGTPRLRPGPIVLRGTVEAPDARPVVEIRIEQSGREYRVKYGYRHKFTEERRTTTARPFHLVLDDGTKVEVRPPKDARLVDELETTSQRGVLRTRTARLTRGESVAVSGVLSEVPIAGGTDGGYRGGSAKGFVLVPPPGAVLSASHLAEASWRWSRFHWLWASVILVTLTVGQTLLWIDFYDVAWLGERRMAVVTELSTYETSSRHGRVTHFVVRGRLDDGEALEAEVTARAFTELAEGDRIPWRVVRGRTSHHQIGSRLQVSWLHLAFFLFAHALLAVAYVAHRRSTTRWWEHERLVDDHPGRLP